MTNASMSLESTVKAMGSPDYKDRFRAEYFQLQIRRYKLAQMLNAWDNGTLQFEPSCPRNILEAQLRAMDEYQDILDKRAAVEHIEIF